jgi:hypothetical protein
MLLRFVDGKKKSRKVGRRLEEYLIFSEVRREVSSCVKQ